MQDHKPRIVVTRTLPETVEHRLRSLFGAEINPTGRPMDAEALKEAARTADVLATTVVDAIDASVIGQAGPRLKLIANFGVGVNNIDLAAAKERGIIVTNTPDVLTDDTADIAILLMLSVMRRGYQGMKIMENGSFAGWNPIWMMGRTLAGKKLGIVGMGRIGQAVARRARAFGMQIHYNNRSPVPDEISRDLSATYWPDLDAMLPEMDVVSLNCPRTKETYHLMNAERLARMRPTAFLINTARGDVIDESALAAALEKNTLAGVGLDVFEHEPKVHPGLVGRDNAVLLPHIGSGTIETRTAMGEKVIANIEAVLAGKEPPDRVV
jgi:glyoxylate reductase